jgi:ADP-ribose pyrophosphatase
MDKFKLLKQEFAFKGNILNLYTHYIQVPNGNIAKWDCIHHIGAAAILPVNEDGKILLVRQYRCGTNDEILEIPAGCRNTEKEDYKVCAARELEEETGYASTQLHHLIDYRSAPAYSSELVSIFYTEQLIPSKQNLDENEVVEIQKYSLSDLISMIEKGEITDGKTIAAIFAYKNLKEK